MQAHLKTRGRKRTHGRDFDKLTINPKLSKYKTKWS